MQQCHRKYDKRFRKAREAADRGAVLTREMAFDLDSEVLRADGKTSTKGQGALDMAGLGPLWGEKTAGGACEEQK